MEADNVGAVFGEPQMIVECPECRGKAHSSVFGFFGMEACRMCNDEHVIDTERVCECGRPAVRVVDNENICLRKPCLERVLRGHKAEKDEKNLDGFEGIYCGH